MTHLLVKSVIGSESHCVNLLDEILCHGPDSLSLVAGGRQMSFNGAILCSLSPLLSTLVKQSTEDKCCSIHDHIFVFLPDLSNWKTMKQLKTFMSSGIVSHISREEIDDLRNLLQTLGFSISCEAHPDLQAGDEEEEEQFFVEIKYEAEDDSELVEKQDLFTRIQLEQNEYKEIKKMIASSSASIGKDITDVGNIDQEMMKDEDLEINQGADGTLPTNLDTSNTIGNYNTEIIHETKFAKVGNKLSKGSKRLRKRKIDETIIPTIDAMELEVVESAPVSKDRQDFECQQSRISYSSCRNKTLPARIKRKLLNRKAKHSVFEVTENECRRSKIEEDIRNVTQKGVPYTCSNENVLFPCNKCDYKGTQLHHLKQHLKVFHEKVQYSCDQCDYKSKYMGELKRHIQSVHNEMRYSCNKCDFKSTHKNSLVRHNRSIHEGVKYSCTKCHYEATQLNNLKLHVKSVHEGVQFPCSKCDYKGTQLSLKQHMEVIHKAIKYSCSQCDYKSNYMEEFEWHIRSVHNTIFYVCSKCDFKSTHKNSLVRHNRSTHEGVKYSCTKCDYEATQLNNLKLHVKSVHEGVRFPCSKCDYKSTNKKVLVRHNKEVHEGVKYLCSKCDFKCPRFYLLKEHEKSAH